MQYDFKKTGFRCFILILGLAVRAETFSTGTQSLLDDSAKNLKFMWKVNESSWGSEPCSNLSYDLAYKSLSQSKGSKEKYFETYRNLAQTTLSSVPLPDSGVRITSSEPEMSVLCIGDSIVRELCQVYTSIVEHSKIIYLESMKLDNYKGRLAHLTKAKEDEVLFRKAVRDYVKKAATGISLAFFGGFNNHHLFKKDPGHSLVAPGGDPLEHHNELMRKYFSVFKDIAAEYHFPVIYVGAMPMDMHILLLRPQNKAWNSFNEASLLSLWDAGELDVFGDGNLWKGVHFFRPVNMALSCPGIRCDGVHFGSDFGYNREGDWNCRSSINIWQPYLASYLIRTFS